MLTPAEYEIVCYQGATLDKTFTAAQDGTPINWTGYTAKLQVRRYPDSDAVLTLATGGQGITTLTNDGKVSIVATATQTGAITAGNYVYDLELTSGTYVVRLVQGAFTVQAQVTQ
jgi:hypothetical protein